MENCAYLRKNPGYAPVLWRKSSRITSQSFQLEKRQLKDILMVVDFCMCVEIDAFGPKSFE